jgi:hypothetical protein
MDLHPHLYLIRLWISGHKMMYVRRKRYGLGYLSLLSVLLMAEVEERLQRYLKIEILMGTYSAAAIEDISKSKVWLNKCR